MCVCVYILKEKKKRWGKYIEVKPSISVLHEKEKWRWRNQKKKKNLLRTHIIEREKRTLIEKKRQSEKYKILYFEIIIFRDKRKKNKRRENDKDFFVSNIWHWLIFGIWWNSFGYCGFCCSCWTRCSSCAWIFLEFFAYKKKYCGKNYTENTQRNQTNQ